MSKSNIIVALDFNDEVACLQLAEQLDPKLCRVKVGKELFTACGPKIVEQLQSKGFEVFLDLKFHDIPNTVASAVKAAANLGVWMLNVHASGGARMMDAAVNAVSSSSSRPIIIAVTVLTSMTEEDLTQIGINQQPIQQVSALALLAKSSGLDGIVCSASEVMTIKQKLGKMFCCVTPGIRPASSDADDQRRIVTPQQAIAFGSDYLVIGRPVTQAPDPHAALDSILKTL